MTVELQTVIYALECARTRKKWSEYLWALEYVLRTGRHP